MILLKLLTYVANWEFFELQYSLWPWKTFLPNGSFSVPHNVLYRAVPFYFVFTGNALFRCNCIVQKEFQIVVWLQKKIFVFPKILFIRIVLTVSSSFNTITAFCILIQYLSYWQNSVRTGWNLCHNYSSYKQKLNRKREMLPQYTIHSSEPVVLVVSTITVLFLKVTLERNRFCHHKRSSDCFRCVDLWDKYRTRKIDIYLDWLHRFQPTLIVSFTRLSLW